MTQKTTRWFLALLGLTALMFAGGVGCAQGTSQPRTDLVDAPPSPEVAGVSATRPPELRPATPRPAPPRPATAAALPAAPATPTAAALLSGSTLTPEATVRLFYQLLSERRYADLRGVTTGDVFTTIPDATALADRTPAGALTVERADVTEQDASGNTATVAVVVSERLDPHVETTRRYVGTWELVRGPAGWLLSGSNLRVE